MGMVIVEGEGTFLWVNLGRPYKGINGTELSLTEAEAEPLAGYPTSEC